LKDNNLECDFDKEILPKMKYYAALSIESVSYWNNLDFLGKKKIEFK